MKKKDKKQKEEKGKERQKDGAMRQNGLGIKSIPSLLLAQNGKYFGKTSAKRSGGFWADWGSNEAERNQNFPGRQLRAPAADGAAAPLMPRLSSRPRESNFQFNSPLLKSI